MILYVPFFFSLLLLLLGLGDDRKTRGRKAHTTPYIHPYIHTYIRVIFISFPVERTITEILLKAPIYVEPTCPRHPAPNQKRTNHVVWPTLMDEIVTRN